MWLKGTIAWTERDFTQARPVLAEALPVFRRLGETFMLGWSLYDLGLLAVYEHQDDEARESLSEALRIFFQHFRDMLFSCEGIPDEEKQGIIDRFRQAHHIDEPYSMEKVLEFNKLLGDIQI